MTNAIADLTEAIRLSPKNPGPRAHFLVLSVARAYEEKGDHDKAIADATEAIRLISAARPPYLGANGSLAVTVPHLRWTYLRKGDSRRPWWTPPRWSRPSIRRTRRAFFVCGYAYGKKRCAGQGRRRLGRCRSARCPPRRAAIGVASSRGLDDMKCISSSFIQLARLRVTRRLAYSAQDWDFRPSRSGGSARSRPRSEAERAKFEESLEQIAAEGAGRLSRRNQPLWGTTLAEDPRAMAQADRA